MDPFAQGLAGAALASTIIRNNEDTRVALVVGFLAGLAPDLDVFIHSSEDPLLRLEFHRQFTHSLFFIPLGGLLVAIFLWPFLRRKCSLFSIWKFSVLGYGTHGLIDSCTSYGTYLFWPFSYTRVAWNNVSIVDPVFSLGVLLFLSIAFFRRKPRLAHYGFTFGIFWLLLGLFQRERARIVTRALAEGRGHEIERLVVKPTIFNNLLWRSTYLSDDRIYADAIRLHFFSEPTIHHGVYVPLLDYETLASVYGTDSRAYKDTLRFTHFSDGFVALKPGDPNVIGDVRYSLLPNSLDPVWGIRIDPDNPDSKTLFENFRKVDSLTLDAFLNMLFD
ncbi:MAG: hydrolase [Opitutae bacterium]|nr:hydrolase [Opitutae bacterium]